MRADNSPRLSLFLTGLNIGSLSMKNSINLKSILRIVVGVSTFVLCVNSYALDKIQMSKLNVKEANIKLMGKQKTLLVLASDDKIKLQTESIKPSSRVLVVVDDRVVEIDRWLLETNIRNGFFKIIWVGDAQDRITLCRLKPEQCLDERSGI